MIRAFLIFGLVGVFASTAMCAPGLKKKHREARTRVELKLLSHAELSHLRVGVIDGARVRKRVSRITDMMLVMSAGGADVDAVLRAPDSQRPSFGRALFRARIFVVTNGRIHTGSAAWCSRWRGNSSMCELDCDGGVFGLARLTSGRVTRLDLMIDARDDSGLSSGPGFSINACQYDASHQLRVIPAAGKRAVALAFEGR